MSFYIDDKGNKIGKKGGPLLRHGTNRRKKEKLADAKDAEIAALTERNWQLMGALGYPCPGEIREDPTIKNGIAEALNIQLTESQGRIERAIAVLERVKWYQNQSAIAELKKILKCET